MRYEVMRLLQFAFSLGLIFAAFMGGIYVGWRRWGRPGPVDHTTDAGSRSVGARRNATRPEGRASDHAGAPHGDRTAPPSVRPDLFAPEIDGVLDVDGESVEPASVLDLRVPPPPVRLGLPTGVDPTAPGGASPFVPPEPPT